MNQIETEKFANIFLGYLDENTQKKFPKNVFYIIINYFFCETWLFFFLYQKEKIEKK